MTYHDTVTWMFQQLPMYQNQGKTAYKADLENTLQLVDYLEHPEANFKSIHVAGTNGKGSTSHMLASILQEAGYKVGLYTSPHLKDFRERIKINGKEISETFVVDFIEAHQSFFLTHKLSFFEMTVGMAFDYFSKNSVDVAVIEVGMGGRLDSTNVIVPQLSVITNIGLDHTQFLGNTLAAIAVEKAGIIKSNVPVVIGETQAETESVFKKIAKERHSEILFADQRPQKLNYKSDLIGDYQEKNRATVLTAISVLWKMEYDISEASVEKGLQHVISNTGLNGRWQIVQSAPKIICDTAHNKEGLTYAMAQLQRESYDTLHIVFGVVNDKDLGGIFPLMPVNAHYYFCRPNIPRGLDADELKTIFNAHGFEGNAFKSVAEALSAAKQHASKKDVIYVGGSTFVVAEII